MMLIPQKDRDEEYEYKQCRDQIEEDLKMLGLKNSLRHQVDVWKTCMWAITHINPDNYTFPYNWDYDTKVSSLTVKDWAKLCEQKFQGKYLYDEGYYLYGDMVNISLEELVPLYSSLIDKPVYSRTYRENIEIISKWLNYGSENNCMIFVG